VNCYESFIKKPKLALIERVSHTSKSNVSTKHEEYIEILVLEHGVAEIEISNRKFCIDANQALIIQGKVDLNLLSLPEKQPLLRMVIHDFQLRGYEQNRLMDSGVFLLHHEVNGTFFVCSYFYLEQLQCKQHSALHDELVTSILTSLLLHILCENSNKLQVDVSEITNMSKQFIEENYNQEISLMDIATYINYSVYYIVHTFKKELGISPIQYLMHCRMEKAKELLSTTNRTVSDVALEVGYQNKNYFAMLFKRNTGITPGKYRKQIRF